MKQNQTLRGRKVILILALFFFLLCLKSPVLVKADSRGFCLEKQEDVLYIGGTKGERQPFGVCVPDGMCEVREFSGSDNEFLIRYGTDCPRVCGVTEDGIIVAADSGSALVTAIVEFADGNSLVFTRQITVKPAEIIFTKFADKVQVGEKVVFQVALYGYDEASIRWMTAKQGGAVVGKNYKKTEVLVWGHSKKEDTVMFYIGDLVCSHKIKVEI